MAQKQRTRLTERQVLTCIEVIIFYVLIMLAVTVILVPGAAEELNYIFVMLQPRVKELFLIALRSPLPVVAVAAALGLLLAIIGGYYFNWKWTGLSRYAYSKKTLWDWLQLLIVPAVLAGAALLFNDRNTRTQLDIAADTQREAALQKYIDDISELLLEQELRTTQADDEARSVARTKTLSVLRRLDAERKVTLLQFLHEARLINATNPIIRMDGADLREIVLTFVELPGVNLANANLEKADLGNADLEGANFEGANLERAGLRIANLKHANLRKAELSHTNMYYADLEGANLQGVFLFESFLQEADLRGAQLQDARLYKADLSGAALMNAQLQRVDLQDADLSGAYMPSANLESASLVGANLQHAHVTTEQLARSESLNEATMPDGTKQD